MNAQAGPSRARLSRTIDLSTINIDKTIPQSFSSTSIAPSLSTHRSSTQSTEGWGALHTPRLDRLSLSFSECSIDEDDVVVFGQGREGKDRSIDSVMLDEARTGYWVDLDKTPKPTDSNFKTPKFPSRISSLPKQQPFHTSPENRLKPLPTSPVRLDKPLPLLSSPEIRLDKALPPAPTLDEVRELPAALPDDSPLIPACMLDRYIPPLHLIPPFNPNAPRRKLGPLTAPEPLPTLPANDPISSSQSQPRLVGLVFPTGQPPPVPPRRSSRKERSGQSIPVDQKMVSSSSLLSIGQSASTPQNVVSSTSLSSLPQPAPTEKKKTSSTSLVSLGQAPPLPPPRASSLRSAAARAANASIPVTVKEVAKPKTELPQSPLTRQPRVRSRSAQLPRTTRETTSERQTSYSHASLASILEDDDLPDMEVAPEGSWSLRRPRLRLARAKSQPKLRTREEFGPWRPMGVIPYRCISQDLIRHNQITNA